MKRISINNFNLQVSCIYDKEEYSVRDNGAVLRHRRKDKRRRPNDDQWTFGRPNRQNGYLHIGNVRIHRIVATAFHGEAPTSEHIVDHIDTNRQNNRPENLRWLTRLENALQNPITVKRIELICGSIEAFLNDPSKLRISSQDRNFEWMRRVSPQEAQACLERMHLWAKSDKLPSGVGSLGEWVLKYPFLKKSHPDNREIPDKSQIVEAVPIKQFIAERMKRAHTVAENISFNESSKLNHLRAPAGNVAEKLSKTPELVMARTPGAAQRSWRIPTEFPCCPQIGEAEPITSYASKLTSGAVFCRNDLSTSIVLEAAVRDEGQSVYVICERPETDAVKPWSLAKVTFEDDLYVHTSMGTFFSKEGADKAFCLARGLEWTGGDTFDDFC